MMVIVAATCPSSLGRGDGMHRASWTVRPATGGRHYQLDWQTLLQWVRAIKDALTSRLHMHTHPHTHASYGRDAWLHIEHFADTLLKEAIWWVHFAYGSYKRDGILRNSLFTMWEAKPIVFKSKHFSWRSWLSTAGLSVLRSSYQNPWNHFALWERADYSTVGKKPEVHGNLAFFHFLYTFNWDRHKIINERTHYSHFL